MSVPPPIAVVDTNVLVSGLLVRLSVPRTVLERFRNGAFTLALSPALLGELVGVVTRPSLRRAISREAIEWLFDDLREDALFVLPTDRPRIVLSDPDDDELFACAVAAGARYIVSGDTAVLAVKRFRSIEVLRPTEFLTRLSD